LKDTRFFRQAELHLQIIPFFSNVKVFALKGGTAVNFFIRDLPRLSVDIDLAYLPVTDRENAIGGISMTLEKIAELISQRLSATQINRKYLTGSRRTIALLVKRDDVSVKIEPNLVIRGNEFRGMTIEDISLKDLIQTRAALVRLITESLSLNERRFILSVKQKEPQWGLLGIEHIHELPAVKWKLINLEQMNSSKHQKAVKRLREHLEL
jgi:hypothetical protein